MFFYKSNAFSFTFLHVIVMIDLQNLIEGGVNKQWGRENSPEINRCGAPFIRDAREPAKVFTHTCIMTTQKF